MPKNSSARGYTNVILLLNMKRFVHPEDQEAFETVRGSQALSDALRTDWPGLAASQKTFITMAEDKARKAAATKVEPDAMLTEQVGFATGVFNTRMLEDFTFPTYAVDKQEVRFSEALRTNFQFRNLFERVWDRWEIYIRPTLTGFFVIRLTQRYQDSARPLIALAQDILHLQESLDIVSAKQWMAYNRERYINEPETLALKEKSVMALLDWMGADEFEAGSLLYYPVQWKMAMVIAGEFIEKVAKTIRVSPDQHVRLVKPAPSLSVPLHESYIIHHFDKLLAHPSMIKRTQKSQNVDRVQIETRVTDLHNSPQVRRALVNMLEGTILQKPPAASEDEEPDDGHHFPEPRWSITDSFMSKNIATWNDELCIFDTRTAIIMPSSRWNKFEMAVSTVPSATLRVPYPRYWGSIERMIEFIIEVHVFSQLLEGVSFDLLTEIVQTVHGLRQELLIGDIQFDEEVAGLITKAADLRKQAALAQSLGHAEMWSRAEYVIYKANKLMETLGVPDILMHIERNISSINSVVDQVDEWYLADLSEKSNDRAHYLTIFVTAGSLLLTFLILPSFWADIWQMVPYGEHSLYLVALGFFGSSMAVVSMGFAGFLLYRSLRKWKDIRKMLDRLLDRHPDL